MTETNGIKLTEKEVRGLEMLEGEATAEGAVYHDDATGNKWLTDWDDVARRPDYADYSAWCATCTSLDLGSDYDDLDTTAQEARRMGNAE